MVYGFLSEVFFLRSGVNLSGIIILKGITLIVREEIMSVLCLDFENLPGFYRMNSMDPSFFLDMFALYE